MSQGPDPFRRRILAFEPFDGGSHRAVRASITRHSRHEWVWITRPARDWKWRMRLGAIEMIEQARRQGALAQPIDAIFTTSLLSAADLRGMLPAVLRAVPMILYMHENQAAYPHGPAASSQARQRDVHFAVTNLTGILAADRVLWNSRWNRDSFLAAMADILRAYPDHGDAALRFNDALVRRITRRSTICWPPVELPDHVPSEGVLHNQPVDEATGPHDGDPNGPIRVVWPHRWEHDKGPDELLKIAEHFTESLHLRWIILGERFRRIPPKLEQFRERFGPAGMDVIEHMGYVDSRAEYWQWLRRADWVLSTARHEFFGIAVVEALLAGCLPWLPDRLSYPELVEPLGEFCCGNGLVNTPGQSLYDINPANRPSPKHAALIRSTIRRHLQPAIASNAVARLDDELGWPPAWLVSADKRPCI